MNQEHCYSCADYCPLCTFCSSYSKLENVIYILTFHYFLYEILFDKAVCLLLSSTSASLIPLSEMLFHPLVSSFLVPTSHFIYSTFPNSRLACVPKYPVKSCWTLYILLSSKSNLALLFTTVFPPQPEYKLLGRPRNSLLLLYHRKLSRGLSTNLLSDLHWPF